MRLPGGAATGPSDEPLAVEDLEYAGHAPHLALEVPRVVGQAAAHPGGHLHKLSLLSARSGGAERRARCRTIAGSHSDATTSGVLWRQSRFRGGSQAEGEAVLHADTGTTDVVVEAGAELSCVFGFGMGASSEECYHCGAMAMQALVVGMGKEACGFKRKAGGMCVCDGRWGRNKRGAIGPTAEGGMVCWGWVRPCPWSCYLLPLHHKAPPSAVGPPPM